MLNRKSLSMASALLILEIAATGNAAPLGSRTGYLTFNTPFALPGVSLPAGSYIFERADPQTIDLVRVLSRDRKHVYLTAFTRLVTRPAGMPLNVHIAFGEVRKEAPPPVTVWYPLGDTYGNQFIYSDGRELKR
jgi:hypothetical protein